MKTAQAITDKLAIGLSLMCAIHCLAITSLIALLPSMVALGLDNEEVFHLWMVMAVLPSSAYALTLGCKQHKRYRLLIWGSIGLILLVMALVLGEERIGEAGEKILTVLGAGFVAVGHWFNFRLCQAQKHRDCACPANSTGVAVK
tara:strand:- start:67 stop:501 length:435 start_codon:yes stop_codon:yes gene_type:complete